MALGGGGLGDQGWGLGVLTKLGEEHERAEPSPFTLHALANGRSGAVFLPFCDTR
jgi:hypothetical protein